MTVRIPRPVLLVAIVTIAVLLGYFLASNSGGSGDGADPVIKRSEPCPSGSLATDDGTCVSGDRIDFDRQVQARLLETFYTPVQAECMIQHLDENLSDANVALIEAINGSPDIDSDQSQYPLAVQRVVIEAETNCGSKTIDPDAQAE